MARADGVTAVCLELEAESIGNIHLGPFIGDGKHHFVDDTSS